MGGAYIQLTGERRGEDIVSLRRLKSRDVDVAMMSELIVDSVVELSVVVLPPGVLKIIKKIEHFSTP